MPAVLSLDNGIMTALPAVLSLDNPLIKVYFYYNGILGLKMLSMSTLTAIKRHQYKAFANPEDAAIKKVTPKTDDRVERVRRAHLNDMENILVFSVVSFGYIMTNPPLCKATMLFKAFAAARFVHTIAYAVCPAPQPVRGIAYGIGYFITIFMAVQTVRYFA